VSGSAFALVAVLVGAFLFIVALVVWQEARRRPSYDPLTYVVEDAVRHVETGLALEGEPALPRADIRRILEWEVFYLQGLAQEDRSNPVETVAGGHDASVEFIIDQVAVKHGVTYSRQDVENVLRLEADYLFRIGAVGDPVEDDGGESR
jgi:hypothetical protein